LNHNEQIIEGYAVLVEHATQFYKYLFGPSAPAGFIVDQNCWDQAELVNNQKNEEL